MDLPKTNKYHCDNAEKSFLGEYYKVLEEGGSTKNLAERFKISRKTVQRLYVKYQIEPLSGGRGKKQLNAEEFKHIYFEAYTQGGNLTDIARKMKCSAATVSRRRSKLGLPHCSSWGGRREGSGRLKGSKNKKHDALLEQLKHDQRTNSIEVGINNRPKLNKTDFWRFANNAYHPTRRSSYTRVIKQPGLPKQL